MGTYRLPTAELRAFVDPLDGSMWKCEPILEEEVLAAKAAGLVEDRVWEESKHLIEAQENRDFHVRRIATLLDQDDRGKLVLILFNHTDEATGHIYDGNHRVAAAYVKGDPSITIVIAASDEERVAEVFPNAVKLG